MRAALRISMVAIKTMLFVNGLPIVDFSYFALFQEAKTVCFSVKIFPSEAVYIFLL